MLSLEGDLWFLRRKRSEGGEGELQVDGGAKSWSQREQDRPEACWYLGTNHARGVCGGMTGPTDSQVSNVFVWRVNGKSFMRFKWVREMI